MHTVEGNGTAHKPVQNRVGRAIRSPNGGATLIAGNPGNSGGKKGRSGRKPLAFAAACEALVDTVVLEKVSAYLHKARANPEHPAWRWCAEYVTNYGKGKPAQRVTLTGDEDEPLVMTFKMAHEA